MSTESLDWRDEARRRLAEGMPIADIGRRLGKQYAQIQYATNPEFRERHRETNRQWSRSRHQDDLARRHAVAVRYGLDEQRAASQPSEAAHV